MKKIIYLIGLVSVMASCDKEINITQPTILIKSAAPRVSETLSISVTEYADIDGTRIDPDYFEWDILNGNEEVVYSDFENSASITWIPDSAGYYIIKVKIGYDNNKSITTLKEIIVAESPQSMQKRLIGNWTGNAEHWGGLKWQVDLSFDSIGHYKGKGYNPSNPLISIIHVFYFGHFFIDDPNGGNGQIGIEPSEDVPCTRFEISEVVENKGYGILSVGFEYLTYGNPYHYNCTDQFKIENLQFVNGGKEVTFLLIFLEDKSSDWYLKYHLTKTE